MFPLNFNCLHLDTTRTPPSQPASNPIPSPTQLEQTGPPCSVIDNRVDLVLNFPRPFQEQSPELKPRKSVAFDDEKVVVAEDGSVEIMSAPLEEKDTAVVCDPPPLSCVRFSRTAIELCY